MAWTRECLNEVARTCLGAKLVVVSKREPYIHRRDGDNILCMRPASGLTTALDPMMQACRESRMAPFSSREKGWGPDMARSTTTRPWRVNEASRALPNVKPLMGLSRVENSYSVLC
jgi:trehalose-6-phosphate synthase